MTIQVGDKIPAASLTTMTADGPGPVDTGEYFAGRKVVVFSVPGAFTPTCSAKHLPGFVEKADDIKSKGIDEIACFAVNDVFVMHAWGEGSAAAGKVTMLADGNGDFTKAIGLEMDASGFGMGLRSKRFSMIVDDGTVTELNVEEPGAFQVSSAEHALSQL
jgi:peroxiredoxin